jgi:hypothetical protein
VRSVIYKTIALQYLAVLLGVTWWRITDSYYSSFSHSELWLLPGVLALIILGSAFFWSWMHDYREGEARVASLSGALAGYAVLIMLWDPFVWGGSEAGDLLGVLLVLPPLLCLRPLVRSRSWLAVCGVVLFSATAIACLLANGGRGGLGFITVTSARECL